MSAIYSYFLSRHRKARQRRRLVLLHSIAQSQHALRQRAGARSRQNHTGQIQWIGQRDFNFARRSLLRLFHERSQRNGALATSDVDIFGGRAVRAVQVLGSRAVAVGQGGLVFLSRDSAGARWGDADLKLPAPRPLKCGLRVDKVKRLLGESAPLPIHAALDRFLEERRG